MKRPIIVLIAWLLPAVSLAQPTTGTTPPTHALPAGFTPPSPTGSAHTCDQSLYPPAAVAAGEEGDVGLAFRVGIDGFPKNATIDSSSGYPDLDQAAAGCASQWKYIPATQDGHAVEADWKAAVHWSLNQQLIEAVKLSGPPGTVSPTGPTQQLIGKHGCQNPSKPPAPLGKQTVVALQVQPDGGVTNVKLAKSSGDEALDDLAIACVSKWQFTPLPSDAPHPKKIVLAPINW